MIEEPEPDNDKIICDLLRYAIHKKYGKFLEAQHPWQNHSFQCDHLYVTVYVGHIQVRVSNGIDLGEIIHVTRRPLPRISNPAFDIDCVFQLFNVIDFVEDIFTHVPLASCSWVGQGIKQILSPHVHIPL